jgi:hypothetical protein
VIDDRPLTASVIMENLTDRIRDLQSLRTD